MSSPGRQLVEAIGDRLQALSPGTHSGIDLTEPARTHSGRWGRTLPTSPPIAFVYRLTNQAQAANALSSRTRAPTVFVDVWIGRTNHTARHLVAIDLEADLMDLFEDNDWLKATRTGLGLTSLKLTSLKSMVFPGHAFAHPDREMVRLELALSWRTPCQ